jgi:IPT/TIG domain-containing protein/Big-like domain-containing protein/galactose oxidase-like protein/Kelch motif protein
MVIYGKLRFLCVAFLTFCTAVAFAQSSPQISSVFPASAPPGAWVTVSGAGFGTTQGTATQNGSAVTVTYWSDTNVSFYLSSSATSGPIVITTVGGASSNAFSYAIAPSPTITSLSPSGGPMNSQMSLTINGSGFGSSSFSAAVSICGISASIVSWSDTQVVVNGVTGCVAGPVPARMSFWVNRYYSNTFSFNLTNLSVASLSPSSAPVGSQVRILGAGFGSTQNGGVSINGVAANVLSWNDTSIAVTVPAGATSGPLAVTAGGYTSNSVNFSVIPQPQITSLSPSGGPMNSQTTLTINGSGFGTSSFAASVSICNINASIVSWSDTQIVVNGVLGCSPSGPIPVQISFSNGDYYSNIFNFNFVDLNVDSSWPTSGPIGEPIRIQGQGFGAVQNGGSVTFNGIAANVISWNDTTISVTVPSGATTGPLTVTAGGYISNSVNFAVVPPPQITSLSPPSGVLTPSTTLTINGSGFGTSSFASTVAIGGTYAQIDSWSDTAIVVTSPGSWSSPQSLPVQVSVAGVFSSNTVDFLVGGGPTLSSVTVSPVNSTLFAGKTQQFTATGTYSDNSTQDVTSTATWSSSAASVESINASGLGVALGAGQASIQASVGSVNGSASVSVTALPASGNLLYPRFLGTATRLSDGTVLVAGGTTGIGGLADTPNVAVAEVYNEQTGAFSAVGSLITPRNNHTASLLNNGMVLLAGGYDNNNNALASAELYDPTAQTFSATGSMSTPRTLHTASVMSGLVLIAGGLDANGNDLASAEVYNPATGTFVGTGSMTTARNTHAATRLNDGTVLITGGFDANGNALASAEIYDPGSGSFTAVANMTTPRDSHTATLLNNGTVLIIGGYDNNGNVLNTAELYDPKTQTFTATAGALTDARAFHTATLLMDGTVLVAGGQAGFGSTVSSMELYDPATGTFSSVGTMWVGRYYHTATRLDDGSVLIAGGQDATFGGFNVLFNTNGSTDMYRPASVTPVGLVSIMLSPGSPVVPAGTSQPLAAIGTFTDNSVQTLASPTWSTSDPTLATVTSDATNYGGFFGVAPGVPITTACAGAICGSTLPNISAPLLSLTDLSPASGAPGMPVTISGTQFGTGQGTVTFNGTPANILSWTPAAIVVSVPAGATTGNVVVTVNGINSNGLLFTIVPRPQISNLSPAIGVTGTQVTVTGTNFGAAQGNGSVITFNGTPGTVLSWSDSVIVVSVPNGASTGNVLVSVSGLASNAALFTVPVISNINPSSGPPGILLTIIGSGFGGTQGNGTAMVGNVPMTIFTWTDSQIVGAPGPGTITGPVTVQQGSLTLNGPTFTVISSFPYNVSPNSLSMVVGDSRTVSVTDPKTDNPITGLSWFATDTSIVSLSTDDPPVITALAPGSVTVYAGEVPLAINVYATSSAMPPGTPIWSVPVGAGNGPIAVVPAVPSSSGVDAFTLDSTGAVTGFSSDGIPTVKVQGIFTEYPGFLPATVVPDFSGNAVAKVLETYTDSQGAFHSTHVVRQANFTAGTTSDLYTFSDHQDSTGIYSDEFSPEVVIPHPGGMLFVQDFAAINLIDPSGVQPSTSISLPISNPQSWQVGKMIVAGDGNAYIPFVVQNPGPSYTLNVMWVAPDGSSSTIALGTTPNYSSTPVAITNADQGVAVFEQRIDNAGRHTDIGYASQNGSASLVSDAAVFPNDGSGPFQFTPELQREDGSYIGTDGGQNYVMAMAQSGGILWQKQMGSFLQNNNVPVKALYATSGGGVIFTTSPSAHDCAGGDLVSATTLVCQGSPSTVPDATGLLPSNVNYSQLGTLYTLDPSGNPAVDQDGNPNPPLPDSGSRASWTGDWFDISSSTLLDSFAPVASFSLASSWGSIVDGNYSNKVAVRARPVIQEFIPFNPQVGIPMDQYRTDFQDAVPLTIATSNFYLLYHATVTEFLKRLANADENTVISFIGHGNPDINNPNQSVGLCFANANPHNSNPNCTIPNSSYPPYPLVDPPKGIDYEIVDSFSTKARIVFLAACDIGPVLEQFWNITPKTTGQALIVPDRSKFSGDVSLFHGAAAWQVMATALANGSSVQGALSKANTYMQQQTYSERWTFVGDGNVTIAKPLSK